MFVNVSPCGAHVNETISYVTKPLQLVRVFLTSPSSLHFASKANACQIGVAKKTKKVRQ